jgi:iron complex transport system permease protein
VSDTPFVSTIAVPWWRRLRAHHSSSAAVSRNESHRASRVSRKLLWIVAVPIAFLIGILALAIGAFPIAPSNVVSILGAGVGLVAPETVDAQQAAVLWSIRMPRVLLGAAVGAGLAVAGALMQGLFRNPIADPGLIGVTSGAALAAAFVIVLGGVFPGTLIRDFGNYLLPVAAFVGGAVAAFVVKQVATRDGVTSIFTMLLAGIAISALASAGIGLLAYVATDTQLRLLTFWTLGSLGSANWSVVAIVGFAIAIALMISRKLAAPLNALALGEFEAKHLGVDVQRMKNIVLLVALAAVGVSVAFCGMIGFIGLVAPHCVRLLCGPYHRMLLPASALLGATLLVAADLVGRTIVAPAELPIGILTALLGVPFFVILLRRQRGHGYGA